MEVIYVGGPVVQGSTVPVQLLEAATVMENVIALAKDDKGVWKVITRRNLGLYRNRFPKSIKKRRPEDYIVISSDALNHAIGLLSFGFAGFTHRSDSDRTVVAFYHGSPLD